MRYAMLLLVFLSGCVAETRMTAHTTPKTPYELGLEVTVK